jgi:hypothetical protein
MSSAKHSNSNSVAAYDKGYEENVIGVKGIAYFGIGLLILIVITFGLMWVLMGVLEDNKKAEMDATRNPMAMSEREALPPEPRLQLAPGFGVDGPNGRTNLELNAPQSEWWELKKHYQQVWKEGMKDPSTGAVSALPIEQAKEAFLSQQVKARTGTEAQRAYEESKLRFSDASSGRTATDRRR